MNAVKSYRLAAGLTQEELAKRTQLPSSTLSKIENDIRRLKADELPRFARALGCAPQDLIPPSRDDVHALIQHRGEETTETPSHV